MQQDNDPQREAYIISLTMLIQDTKGMEENIEPSLEKFKRQNGPHADRALNYLVDNDVVDKDTYKAKKRGFFSDMLGIGNLDTERVMPDGTKVIWDGLCECYVLSPEEEERVKRERDEEAMPVG